MKSLITFFVILSLAFAHGHEHTWVDATCTTPKTCSECGETEGESLGHDWKDATCSIPKTCSRCGTSEGQALEHIPTEADYWNPSVCSLCGVELAPAIEPDFVKYKFDTFCELGVSYDYRTICANGSAETVGKFTVISYETTKGKEYNLKEKDGYEWKIVKFVISFSDANAQKWDVYAVPVFDDYYDTRLMNESCDQDIDGVFSWGIHWNGEITKCYFCYDISNGWSNGVKTYNETFYFQVPEGYDGVVIGATKPGSLEVGETENAYIFDTCDKDSLFFRLT